ncbi:hypothetical protein B0H13DRAFT_1643595, partial [Mycena leptocephala]
RSFTELFEKSELWFNSDQSPTLADFAVTCQVAADNGPWTIPFHRSFKALQKNYMWDKWLTHATRSALGVVARLQAR